MITRERITICLLALAVAFVALRPSDAPARLAAQADGSVAVCAVPMIVNELMGSERFLPAREDRQSELEEEIQPLVDEARDLVEDIRAMPEDDPQREATARRLGQLQRQIQQARAEAARAMEQLTAEQLSECFRLVRSSAEAVAEDLGYEYVISSVGQDEELNTESVETLLRQMTARPVISAPEEADITEDVREDLNLG